MAGLDKESPELFVQSRHAVTREHLADAKLLEFDRNDEFPEHIVRDVFGGELGVQLLFLPEEHGGLGGSAFDIYRVSEEMARVDLGIATAVLDDAVELVADDDTTCARRRTGAVVCWGDHDPAARSSLGSITPVPVPVPLER